MNKRDGGTFKARTRVTSDQYASLVGGHHPAFRRPGWEKRKDAQLARAEKRKQAAEPELTLLQKITAKFRAGGY